jgi:hypothetical protein
MPQNKNDKPAKTVRQAVKAAGPKISTKELKQIEKKFGAKGVTRTEKIVKAKPEVSFKPKTQDWLGTYKENLTKPPVVNPTLDNQEEYDDTTKPPDFIGYSQEEYEAMVAGILGQIQGNIDLEKQQAGGLTDVKVASIGAEAAKYGYDRDLEAKKYMADQDLLKGTRVAEIEGQNRINLQGIINAGLKEVEETRGQSERTIARIGSQAGFRNALIGAFNF